MTTCSKCGVGVEAPPENVIGAFLLCENCYDQEEKVPITNLKDVPGSLASGYRSTATALHLLLCELNRLEELGNLPRSNRLTERMLGGMVAMKLAQLHFPELDN